MWNCCHPSMFCVHHKTMHNVTSPSLSSKNVLLILKVLFRIHHYFTLLLCINLWAKHSDRSSGILHRNVVVTFSLARELGRLPARNLPQQTHNFTHVSWESPQQSRAERRNKTWVAPSCGWGSCVSAACAWRGQERLSARCRGAFPAFLCR